MSRLAGDPTRRMREAFTVEMSAATKQAHEASIGVVLNTVGGSPVGVRTASWRVRVPALAAALLVVLPLGTAFAAEGAVPGDLLYPVKRLVEPIRSVVDSDVVAQHRVDELEELMGGSAESDRISNALTDARDAVGDLPADHLLRTRFDALTDPSAGTESASVPSSDEQKSDHPAADRNTDQPKIEPGSDRPQESDDPTDRPMRESPVDELSRHDGSDSHTEKPPSDRDVSPSRDG